MSHIVDGYREGKRFDLAVVSVDGVLMGFDLGIKYLGLAAAARSDGIVLVPTSGWRSMDEQRKLARNTSRPVARPGYSRHQSGRAVDIATGMSIADLAAGRTTAIFEWIAKHAAEHGFTRPVRVEPWHYEVVG